MAWKNSQPTMTIFIQIGQLLAPLRDDAQRIFQEGHHDQKPSDGRQISSFVTDAHISILDLRNVGSASWIRIGDGVGLMDEMGWDKHTV